jgi:hypothetical protein
MMIATAFVAYYAYVTIREGRKNRRKDTIEKMLEHTYSPLYELLRRAQFASDRVTIQLANPQREYALTEEEFREVWEIIERFGHYLGSQERMALTKDLEQKHDLYSEPHIGRYYRWRLVDMDEHWQFIWRTCEDLRRELDTLTKM